jgi:hypothetical protein
MAIGSDQGERYEIVVSKRLGSRSATGFEEFELEPIPGDGMLLRGSVADQAGLHGVLGRLRDLGIPIVSVRRVEPGEVPVTATADSENPG